MIFHYDELMKNRDCTGANIMIPELKKLQPYDPFKVDVFTIGNVFFKELYQVFVPSFALLIRQTKHR